MTQIFKTKKLFEWESRNSLKKLFSNFLDLNIYMLYLENQIKYPMSLITIQM